MKHILIVAAMLVLPCTPSFAGSDKNIEIVKSMVAAINARDFDALETFVADDLVRHSAATPRVQVRSREQFIDFLKADLIAVPESVQEIEMIFSADNMAALRAHYRGTQTGPLGPFPPSGKSVDLPFLAILRIEDDKVAEIWVEWDNLGMLTALGHITAPIEATPAEQ